MSGKGYPEMPNNLELITKLTKRVEELERKEEELRDLVLFMKNKKFMKDAVY